MATLQIHQVSKKFKQKQVLNNISLSLKSGDILGLYGRNGCGKSTLLTILSGVIKADSGHLKIDEEETPLFKNYQHKKIAYLPQQSFLPKNEKVRDIIPIMHPEEKKQDAIFYDPHIATITSHKIGTLSQGELKYFEVLLLSQLAHPFLLYDEPFSMVAPHQKEKMQELFVSLKKDKAIIITDHYFHDVWEIANANAVIKDGILHHIETKGELKKLGYLRS